MGVSRRNEIPKGDWIVDAVTDLSSVQDKTHGTRAYIVASAIWAIYNAYTGNWNILLTGIVPAAESLP